MHIFVSRHHEDEEWTTDFLNAALARHGHQALIVSLYEMYGRRHRSRIFQADDLEATLRHARLAVVVLSDASVRDEWFYSTEWPALVSKSAHDGRTFVIPIILGELPDADVPRIFADEPLPRFAADGADFDRAFDDLLKRVEAVAPDPELLVFCSHSSDDAAIASAVVTLLRTALQLAAADIIYTTDGLYGLGAGESTSALLRRHLLEAKLVVGLVTPNSLRSSWALMELGARWGAGRPLLLAVAGITAGGSTLGPLADPNAPDLRDPAQVYRLVEAVCRKLGRASTLSPPELHRHVDAVVRAAAAAPASSEPR